MANTAALRVSQIVGNESTPVKYVSLCESYYSKLSKACGSNSASSVPVITCLGTERLAIEFDEAARELKLSTAQPFPTLRKKPKLPSFVYGLWYQPAGHTGILDRDMMAGIGRILDFIRPLFPDVRSMVTYMW